MTRLRPAVVFFTAFSFAALLGGCTSPHASGVGAIDGRYIDTVPKGEARQPTPGEEDLGLVLQQSTGFGVLAAPALEAKVNEIYDRLKKVSPRTHLPGKAYVLISDLVNAEAEGDGNIFVTLGLLEHVQSEDELAAAMAHETGHVILEHYQADWFTQGQRRALGFGRVGVTYGGSVALVAAQKHAAQVASKVVYAAVALEAAKLGEQAYEDYGTTWFKRHQEDEADLLGLDLLIAAGYSPEGNFQLLERLSGIEAQSAPTPTASPTPTSTPRAADTKALDPTKFLSDTIDKYTNQGIESGKQYLKDAQADHRGASERLADLRQYAATAYPKLVSPPLQVDSLKAALSASPTSQILANHARARQAREVLAKGDMAAAASVVSRAVKPPTASHTVPRFVEYEVLASSGKTKESVKSLELVLKNPDPPLHVLLTLAEAYLATGRAPDALQLLERADARYRKPPVALPDFIQTYFALDQSLNAEAAKLACATWGNDELVATCDAVYKAAQPKK